jgi:hypothetical protein
MPRDLKKEAKIERNEMNTVNREKITFYIFLDRKIHYYIYENVF